jgi:hypothetical protein
MRRHAVIEPTAEVSIAPASAIVTICANQKRFKAGPNTTPAALAPAPQAALASTWLDLIGATAPVAAATDLYGGRAFGLARDLAAVAGTKLFIVSAGFGLVPGSQRLPAYSLTVARQDPDSIQGKAVGPFDPAAWFEALTAGPYSVAWRDVFSEGVGRVLVALTKPYAEMATPALAKLPASDLCRLRLFGAGLGAVLPTALKPYLLPYDDRLDTLFPGTRSDFAQRALVHFVQNVAVADGDSATDAARARALLAAAKAPSRPERRAATDEALLNLIRARLSPRASASRLLRQLRDEDQIACEQGRFARLFRQAQTEGSAHDAP